MIRNVLAVVAGIVGFVAVITAVEWLAHLLYPPPDYTERMGVEEMRAMIAALPVGAVLSIAIAWWLGAAGGTLISSAIGTLKPRYFGAVIGGLVLALSITQLMLIPHPLWFVVVSLPGIAAASWGAIQLADRWLR